MTDETNLEDIVVLINTGFHTEVIKFTDKNLNKPSLSIDLRLGIWSYRLKNSRRSDNWNNIPIGKARSVQGNRSDEGVIGVYNIKYFEHIKSMIYDAIQFSREPANYFIDN